MRRSGALAALASAWLSVGAGTPARAVPVPLDAASPWPEMRHDSRNTGASESVADYFGDRPWAFATGRGIFSTPVLGGDGSVYVGSGDTYFYALGSDGRLRWRIKTGGLIDAAGALSAFDSTLGSAPLTFGSADEKLYHVTTPAHGRPRIVWTYRASVPPVAGQRVDWWEGNVAVGPGGVLYAGNTGGTAYAIRPDGRLLWRFTAANSLWTTPAFGPDGSSFWGSLDFHIYRLGPTGLPQWKTFTPGYVISSPAIGADGTVYVGSFDSRLYALDPVTGAVRWSVKTSDHIYSSPALADAGKRTTAIYFASASGSVYAVTPRGRLKWSFDTGAPVRSSPALGRAPGGRGWILYVGSSNGRLYALNAATGRLRWSFDTTLANPYLAVRNNLNSSPALGRTGVYITGEDGYVYYVPYDYCLHRRDPRCSTALGPALAPNVDRVFGVDVGGNTLATRTINDASPATMINLRLIVRRRGRTVNAAILSPATVVRARPAFPFTTEESGDGRYLYVLPKRLLRAGTTYSLRVAGAYTDNGTSTGNFDPHGKRAGSFSTTITVKTVPARRRASLPLIVGRRQVSALTISRLSVPMPAFLSSVNQIGFDSYDWIASAIARTKRTVLLWVIGARPGAGGRELVDPTRTFAFPLHGTYAGDAVTLHSPNVSLQFSFGAVPLRTFELRGTLGPGLRFAADANLFADTVCRTVPYYGPELLFTGICNPSGVLAASGAFISRGYTGSANRRPAGVAATAVKLVRPTATAAGSAQATFTGRRLPAAGRHVAAILLSDAATGAPVALDYQADTTSRTDARRITGVRLTIPAGTRLPARLRAYVIVDAFPIAHAVF
ncbi:MAG TPA: PQQ-binding-like beta-propeller repeat protein [Solirubrobacteraceae bacterium]|nr:PQQ-binding-like beta-propeller repeat protein [Solirubrobacteraceae bacterium]